MFEVVDEFGGPVFIYEDTEVTYNGRDAAFAAYAEQVGRSVEELTRQGFSVKVLAAAKGRPRLKRKEIKCKYDIEAMTEEEKEKLAMHGKTEKELEETYIKKCHSLREKFKNPENGSLNTDDLAIIQERIVPNPGEEALNKIFSTLKTAVRVELKKMASETPTELEIYKRALNGFIDDVRFVIEDLQSKKDLALAGTMSSLMIAVERALKETGGHDGTHQKEAKSNPGDFFFDEVK